VGTGQPGLQEPGSTRVLSGSEGEAVVRRTVLAGGLRIITETMPAVRSVAFGVWVGVGSRDETPRLAGTSHYLEHLLFKGTRRRDAMEIAAVMDAVGGEMNAFTTKEYTTYYARVLDDDLPLAVDVVCDMVTSARIAAADVESERGVILEEIAMHDDDPADVVHDAFAAAVFGDTPLGRPVIGTVESISALPRSSIHGYYRRRYRPENVVVAAAGNLEHDRVVELVRAAFAGALDHGTGVPVPPRSGGAAPAYRPSVAVHRRPIEQANLVLGMRGLSRTDDRRFALGVLNGALGGGMSSRLFQEVREKRGLAYSVYSYAAQFADTGLFGVYAGCQPARVDEVLALCREQLATVAADGITAEELERGKGQARGGLVLALEDTGSRMSRLGKSELSYYELLSVEEILGRIQAVTLDDVRAVAGDVLTGPLALAVIGPFDDHDFAPAVG